MRWWIHLQLWTSVSSPVLALSVQWSDQAVAHTDEQAPNNDTDSIHDAETNLSSMDRFLGNFNSESCKIRRHAESQVDHYIYCQGDTHFAWSPKYKLAYLKTPKAASTAFIRHFKNTFPDVVTGLTSEVTFPNDTFIFTFVREPIQQKLAAFAEIDVVYQERKFPNAEMHTTFHLMPREEEHGLKRFRQFLRDIDQRNFGTAVPTHWSPSHARTFLALLLCSKSGEVDFVGKLENFAEDWDYVQEVAKLPADLWSMGIAHAHVNFSTLPHYAFDEGLELGDQEKLMLCKLYISDYTCFGYELPDPCKGQGFEISTSVPAAPLDPTEEGLLEKYVGDVEILADESDEVPPGPGDEMPPNPADEAPPIPAASEMRAFFGIPVFGGSGRPGRHHEGRHFAGVIEPAGVIEQAGQLGHGGA